MVKYGTLALAVAALSASNVDAFAAPRSHRAASSSGSAAPTSEYLLGGGDLPVPLVGASLLLSVMSAVFLLGATAEVYYRGTQGY